MIYLAVLCALELTGTFVLVKVLIDERGRAEAAWAAERASLVQRIQAPQLAVTQHHNQNAEDFAPPAVDQTDEGDEDFWEAKEAMAERLAATEVTSG